MVDYLVMRIYQRVGKSTALSVGLGTLLLAFLMLIGLLAALGDSVINVIGSTASIVLALLLTFGAIAYWLPKAWPSADQEELARLQALERKEADRVERTEAEAPRQADLERLREKYQGR